MSIPAAKKARTVSRVAAADDLFGDGMTITVVNP
jgi:hypothetical protein